MTMYFDFLLPIGSVVGCLVVAYLEFNDSRCPRWRQKRTDR